MTTETIPDEKLKGTVKEAVEVLKDGDDREAFERSRKPPKQGPCKRCGKDRPLNRLFLCYSCWIKTRNEKRGWREGLPHPAECGCSLDCKQNSKGHGN